MWWDKFIFGLSAYHVVLWFLGYSILGWIVESIYMSICNRKLTNRGFTRGPMCPIYGVGALSVFFLLKPYSDDPVSLFFLGMFVATGLEFLTALIMNKIFGEIWWDYTEKPFNYKGIICLESSIAWGFYTLGLFLFLHGRMERAVEHIPVMIGKIGGTMLLMVYVIDFVTTIYKEKKEDLPDRVSRIKETILSWISGE